MTDKFRVKITNGPFQDMWPGYFEKFYHYCCDKATANNWLLATTLNYELKPHGRLIQTKTQGMYLRWDDEKYHTHFVLRWS